MSQRVRRVCIALLLLALSLATGGCADDGTLRGTLVFDGQHRFTDGQAVHGDLVVLAGDVAVGPDATVDGSVWLLGGTCEVEGRVNGDVAALAGRLTIADGAQITGNVTQAGSLVQIAPGAHVLGRVTQALTEPAREREPLGTRLLAILQQAMLAAALSLLLGWWFAPALTRVGVTAIRHPAVSLATGVLAGITGLVIVVLVGFTLVLLPLALLLGLGALLAVTVGWAGLGAWLAQRLVSRRLPAPLAIALGSFLFVGAVQLVSLVPVAGAIIAIAAASWGLGAALLTRFGYQEFRPATIPDVERGA